MPPSFPLRSRELHQVQPCELATKKEYVIHRSAFKMCKKAEAPYSAPANSFNVAATNSCTPISSASSSIVKRGW
ncbi:hypothetical protein LG52_3337 [Geobacillus kaustophilus]|uniref:Uncharacterized protein n=1 Tax=Geobacillus kaustophilus TaxID=1462 RepID=A0A0D8BY68_GEOKU|nr:hypothetical protein LG52_3337 [Geobacillus kaustophilus]